MKISAYFLSLLLCASTFAANPVIINNATMQGTTVVPSGAILNVVSGASVNLPNGFTITNTTNSFAGFGIAGGVITSPLQFGGTTSSFPELTYSGSTLQVMLADGSGLANISVGLLTAPNNTVIDSGGNFITQGASISLRNSSIQGINLSSPSLGILSLFDSSTNGPATVQIGAVTIDSSNYSRISIDAGVTTLGQASFSIQEAGSGVGTLTGFTFNASISAPSFSGGGASLTGISAGNVSTGTLAVANGGTGQTTWQAAMNSMCSSVGFSPNSVFYWDGTNFTSVVPPTTSVPLALFFNGGFSFGQPSPQEVNSGDFTAQSSGRTLAALTSVAGLRTYRVGGYVTVTAVSLDVIQLQVTYTDENSNAQTQIFSTPAGLSNLSATGAFVFPSFNIRVKASTIITVKTVLTTGTGSITYDAGGTIEIL